MGTCSYTFIARAKLLASALVSKRLALARVHLACVRVMNLLAQPQRRHQALQLLQLVQPQLQQQLRPLPHKPTGRSVPFATVAAIFLARVGATLVTCGWLQIGVRVSLEIVKTATACGAAQTLPVLAICSSKVEMFDPLF